MHRFFPSRSLAACVAIASLMAAPRAARAQGAPAAAAATDPGQARKLVRDAQRAYQKKDYQAALKAYQDAYALDPRPSTALGAVRSQQALGRSWEAYATLDNLLAGGDTGLSYADRKAAHRLHDELAAKTGTVDLKVSESGAQVTVDGTSAGTTPLARPLRRNAGSHEITVTKDGFVPFHSKVDLAGGDAKTVEAKLETDVKTGHLAVREKMSASVHVRVDGNDVGDAPWQGDLPPGRHTIALESPTLHTQEQSIDVVAKHAYELVLAADTRTGQVRVGARPQTAKITIDGQEVGTGSFVGDLLVGDHTLEVAAQGFVSRKGTLHVLAGQSSSTELTLDAVAPVAPPESAKRKGFEGGFEAFGATSVQATDYPCDATDVGCTSKKSTPFPLGGGAMLRLGYSFGNVAIEATGAFLMQTQSETNTYDGTGPATRPGVVDSSVARTEDFQLDSLGGFGGLGLRLTSSGRMARVTLGVSGGLAMHRLSWKRSISGDVNDDLSVSQTYTAPGVLADLGLVIGNITGAQFKIGVLGWADFPKEELTTPDLGTYAAQSPPLQLTAPPFTLQRTPAFFVGPVLGVHFGP